jgi:hypothetical protein
MKPDRRGPNNSNWKGGTWLNTKGYKMILVPGHPACNCRNYAPEHLVVYWDYHGEGPGELYEVHHWDGNKVHNEISNLEPKLIGEHQSKGHASNGGIHGVWVPLTKGDPRCREWGRKGGRRAARNRRQRERRIHRRRRAARRGR